jgi:protein-S-isoprenylcysteine O-methyltransferase Ste14
MKSVSAKKIGRVLISVLGLTIPVVTAGDIHWIRGWIWVGLMVFTMAANVVVIRLSNPGLLKARMEHTRPTRGFDKAFIALYLISLASCAVLAGVSERLGWPQLSFGWLYLGIAVHLAGMLPIAAAMATNPYLETTVRIQDERGHVVVTSGPYSIVRHPMYVGVPLMILGWPLVLGSLWCYVPAGLVALLFVFRAVHEDRVLHTELAGYEEYTRRTRYRMVPGLW